jgi:hypothetical protein
MFDNYIERNKAVSDLWDFQLLYSESMKIVSPYLRPVSIQKWNVSLFKIINRSLIVKLFVA